MPILSVILILLVVGVGLALIQRIPGIDPTILWIIRVVVILFVVVWLLQMLAPGLGTWTVGPVHRR